MNVSKRLKVEGWIHSNRGLENALRFIFVTWQKSSASAQLIGEAVCRNARSDFCKYQLETCVAGINQVWNPYQNFGEKKQINEQCHALGISVNNSLWSFFKIFARVDNWIHTTHTYILIYQCWQSPSIIGWRLTRPGDAQSLPEDYGQLDSNQSHTDSYWFLILPASSYGDYK